MHIKMYKYKHTSIPSPMYVDSATAPFMIVNKASSVYF